MNLSWHFPDTAPIRHFDTEGTPPAIGTTIYLRDNRALRGAGSSSKWKVERVDYALALNRRHLDTFKFIAKEGEDRFEEMMKIIENEDNSFVQLIPYERTVIVATQEAQITLIAIDTDESD